MPKSSTSTKSTKTKQPSVDTSASSKKPPKLNALSRKDAALRRLKIDKRELEQAPVISDLLKRVLGNTKNAIKALRFSNETCAIEFLETYDSLPQGDRDFLSIEAVAVKANVNTSTLLGALFLAVQVTKRAESSLKAVYAFPDVVDSMVKFSALPGGDKDRKLLAEARVVGFLPTSKGVSMAVNLLGGDPVHAPAEVVQGKDIEEACEDDHFTELFPSIRGSLEEWSEDRKRALSDGT